MQRGGGALCDRWKAVSPLRRHVVPVLEPRLRCDPSGSRRETIKSNNLSVSKMKKKTQNNGKGQLRQKKQQSSSSDAAAKSQPSSTANGKKKVNKKAPPRRKSRNKLSRSQQRRKRRQRKIRTNIKANDNISVLLQYYAKENPSLVLGSYGGRYGFPERNLSLPGSILVDPYDKTNITPRIVITQGVVKLIKQEFQFKKAVDKVYRYMLSNSSDVKRCMTYMRNVYPYLSGKVYERIYDEALSLYSEWEVKQAQDQGTREYQDTRVDYETTHFGLYYCIKQMARLNIGPMALYLKTNIQFSGILAGLTFVVMYCTSKKTRQIPKLPLFVSAVATASVTMLIRKVHVRLSKHLKRTSWNWWRHINLDGVARPGHTPSFCPLGASRAITTGVTKKTSILHKNPETGVVKDLTQLSFGARTAYLSKFPCRVTRGAMLWGIGFTTLLPYTPRNCIHSEHEALVGRVTNSINGYGHDDEEEEEEDEEDVFKDFYLMVDTIMPAPELYEFLWEAWKKHVEPKKFIEYSRACDQERTDKVCGEHELFSKQECNMKSKVTFCTRAVLASTNYSNYHTGPVIYSFTKLFVAHVNTPEVQEKLLRGSRYCLPYGYNDNQFAKQVNSWDVKFKYFVSLDGKRMDSTILPEFNDFLLALIKRYHQEEDEPWEQCISMNRNLFGRTRHGLKFSTDHGLASGVQWTTINHCVMMWFLFISFLPDFPILFCNKGDDMWIASTAGEVQTLQWVDDFRAHCKEKGIILTLDAHSRLSFKTEFLAMRPHHSRGKYHFIPKPGRLLPKLGWSVYIGQCNDPRERARAVADGLAHLKPVPIIGPYIRALDRLTKGVKTSIDLKYEWQYKSLGSLESFDPSDIITQYSILYNVPTSDIHENDRLYDAISDLPFFLDSRLMERCAQIDFGAEISTPAPEGNPVPTSYNRFVVAARSYLRGLVAGGLRKSAWKTWKAPTFLANLIKFLTHTIFPNKQKQGSAGYWSRVILLCATSTVCLMFLTRSAMKPTPLEAGQALITPPVSSNELLKVLPSTEDFMPLETASKTGTVGSCLSLQCSLAKIPNRLYVGIFSQMDSLVQLRETTLSSCMQVGTYLESQLAKTGRIVSMLPELESLQQHCKTLLSDSHQTMSQVRQSLLVQAWKSTTLLRHYTLMVPCPDVSLPKVLPKAPFSEMITKMATLGGKLPNITSTVHRNLEMSLSIHTALHTLLKTASTQLRHWNSLETTVMYGPFLTSYSSPKSFLLRLLEPIPIVLGFAVTMVRQWVALSIIMLQQWYSQICLLKPPSGQLAGTLSNASHQLKMVYSSVLPHLALLQALSLSGYMTRHWKTLVLLYQCQRTSLGNGFTMFSNTLPMWLFQLGQR